MQTIFPILRYDDARAAIRSLCESFGFVERFSVPPTGPFVRHAQLELGTNVVMLGSVRSDEDMQSPRSLGASTQALCVYVAEVDAHYERARSTGADIVSPPEDSEFGFRSYHARDLEGHHWTFGNYSPVASASSNPGDESTRAAPGI